MTLNLEIRSLVLTDIPSLKKIYQKAFAGFPWYENLSEEEINTRWHRYVNYSRFQGLVAIENGNLIGGYWWNIFSRQELTNYHGDMLVRFIKSISDFTMPIVWEAGLVVSPERQRDDRHIGTMLRTRFTKDIVQIVPNCIIIGRMRDDNIPTIKIAEKLGFKRTGIRVPSSQIPGVFHEYWYLQKESN